MQNTEIKPLIAHVKDYYGQIHATVALVNGKFGISVRNKSDKKINKKLATAKAVGRAISNSPEKCCISWGIKHYIVDSINNDGVEKVSHINHGISNAIEYLKGRAEKIQRRCESNAVPVFDIFIIS